MMRPQVLSILALAITLTSYGSDKACPEVIPSKVCVAQLQTKTITKTHYNTKCVDICLPHCSLLSFCGCAADCGPCGRNAQVRKLIKRFVKEEKCETVCKPIEIAPSCATPAQPMSVTVPSTFPVPSPKRQ